MNSKIVLFLVIVSCFLPKLLFAATYEVISPNQYAAYTASGSFGNGGLVVDGVKLAGSTAAHCEAALIGSSYSSSPAYPLRSFSQFDVQTLPKNYTNYYLVFSPRAVWSFHRDIDTTGEMATIYAYEGDGKIYTSTEYLLPEPYTEYYGDISDYNYLGNNFITSTVEMPNDSGSWYTPNNLGGYLGDQYILINNIVEAALLSDWENITFKVDPFSTTAGVFRMPTIIATNIELPSNSFNQPVPISSSFSLMFFPLVILFTVRKLKKNEM